MTNTGDTGLPGESSGVAVNRTISQNKNCAKLSNQMCHYETMFGIVKPEIESTRCPSYKKMFRYHILSIA